MAGAVALCGERGRSASKRGTVCYLTAAVISNGLKPLAMRPQPRHRFVRHPVVARGAFPSGHAAAEVAFTFGAAQELPAVLLPSATMAILAHWWLVRTGRHYLSDMLAGGTIGLGVVAAFRKRLGGWLPANRATVPATSSAARAAATPG